MAHAQVFLSHSGKDKPFVRELHRRLTQDNIPAFLDEVSLSPGANWVTAIEEALDAADAIILVLSPNFLTSEHAQQERDAILAGPSRHKLIPLLLAPCEIPTFLRRHNYLDVTTPALFESNYPRILHELGQPSTPHRQPTDRTKLPPPAALPGRHRMPYRSLGAHFIGRIDAFWQLHDSLFRDGATVLQGAAVVSGAGGLGKTQLAIEYVHRMGHAYAGGIYWVDSHQGLTTLLAQVSTAAQIEIDGKASESAQLEQLWRGLNNIPGPSLIVLDNFPEKEPLEPYLPSAGRIHALITTRRQDLNHASVRLPILTQDEGHRLLNSGARPVNDTAPLIDRLGGLPLALELARGFLNHRTDFTVEALLQEMDTLGAIELLQEFATEYRDQLPSRHELDVARTVQMSWDLAPEEDRRVLRVMGELAPVAVPQELLREVLELPSPSGIRDPLSKALAELHRLSLVERDANGNPVAHRLILAFSRHRNVADGRSPFDRCLQAIQTRMRGAAVAEDGATMRDLEEVVPHAERLLESARLAPGDFTDLAMFVGRHYRAAGRYADAYRVFLAALHGAEEAFECGHPKIIVSQNELALVLQDWGRLEEAHVLLDKALDSAMKTLPPSHFGIAACQSNLATVLQSLGKPAEASDLLRQALASDQKTYPPGHPMIAIRQSNLAVALRELGQLVEARDLLQQALDSDERTQPPGHPNIAIRRTNLGSVLYQLGKLEEACNLLRQALASDERTYPTGHPAIARSQSNLALVLGDLGQLDEARDLLHKSYRTMLANFGPDHDLTQRAKDNLDSLPPA